jgi:hypothetical protein
MENLQHDYKQVEDTLGETMLVLVVAKGYLARVLRNEAIAGYLQRHCLNHGVRQLGCTKP